MADQTSTVLQKQLTPRSIGRLMAADFSGIIILFRLVPYESGVGPKYPGRPVMAHFKFGECLP
jgi:hypothetical protein